MRRLGEFGEAAGGDHLGSGQHQRALGPAKQDRSAPAEFRHRPVDRAQPGDEAPFPAQIAFAQREAVAQR